MDILITGHRGFIGSALSRRLEKNHTVWGIDLKDGDNLLTVELTGEYDVIIHLAGRSGVRESAKDPAAYWVNNVEAARRLFDRYAEDTRIIYASSSTAYEPDLNPYAASKYCLEELASRYPHTLGMRFHTVYSDNCPRKTMLFYKLLNNELEYTTLHYRDFVHLEDVLDAIELLIAKDHVKGVLDIGTGNAVRIQDLAPNLPVRLDTPGERTWTCANTEQMTELGWQPKYTVQKFLSSNNMSEK